jgi:hypothetical protein
MRERTGPKVSKNILVLVLILFSFSCSQKKEPVQLSELEVKMNAIAEDYVKLVLNIGQYDADFVDAYYGPKEWRENLKSDLPFDSTAFNELSSKTNQLLDNLDALGEYKANELETLRYRYLYKQLLACKTKIFMLNGVKLPFDEETKALYDAEAPVHNDEYFQKTVDELGKILPGQGNIAK